MISTVIVVLTLLFLAAYSLAFLLRPDWRRRIEQPKYSFQQQLAQFEARRRGEQP
ncbi:MAG: hypothetical protein PsegKO_09540 [Pseudohongiellaceae bacterium]|jgi:hypothetical protein